MWPLSPRRLPRRFRECVRIGRHAVQRYASAQLGLTLVQEQAIPQGMPPQADTLFATVKALFPSRPAAPVDLVVESAWIPVMAIDAGPRFLLDAELDALVRHGFALHHFDASEAPTTWDLRLAPRPGPRHRHALAYGLPSRLKRGLNDLGRELGFEWASMVPALEWGQARMRSARAIPKEHCWVAWPEQDRTLVVHFGQRGIDAIHGGAPPDLNEKTLIETIAAEGVRLGIDDDAVEIVVAAWGPTSMAHSLSPGGGIIKRFDVLEERAHSEARRTGQLGSGVAA